MKALTAKLINPSSLYVLINIFVSAAGFARSFLFMKWLDNNELGIISLVQTIMMFLGLFQLGLLNGGYRIFALDKPNEQKAINNVLFSYFALILGVVLLFWLTLVTTDTTLIINNSLMLVALMCGVVTLMMNWLTNTLIGKRLIKDINYINLISATISLTLLPIISIWGMQGAIVVLFAQPIIFVSITLMKHKELRPSGWNFNLKLIRYILSFGFIPFLAGIFVMINIQIERWSIADILGTEALGQFYLVFLFNALFVLVPASLSSLFFPKSIKAYEEKNIPFFKLNLKRYTFVLCGYLLVVIVLSVFLLQPIIDFMFPQHSANTVYVFYFLPGLIAYTLCDPIGLIMNSAVKLRPMLVAGILSCVLNVGLIIIAKQFGVFTLTSMTIIKDIVNISVLICYIIFFVKSYRKLVRI